MIETIDHTEVRKYYEKKKDDVWFKKFLQFQEAMDLIFIMKRMNDEIHRLKQEIRELREEKKEVEEIEPEEILEPEEVVEPDEVVTHEIFELPELSLESSEPSAVKADEEPKVEPIEISEFVCPECKKKFPNKGLLNAHIKRAHGEKDEKPA